MASWIHRLTAVELGIGAGSGHKGLAMGFGRMIRVGSRGQAEAVIYVVAEADSAQAVRIVKTKLEQFDGEVEDLGRVSSELLRALLLNPGDMIKS